MLLWRKIKSFWYTIFNEKDCGDRLEWRKNGVLHREDGPAITNNDGAKYWYYHGNLILCNCQEEFEEKLVLKMFW